MQLRSLPGRALRAAALGLTATLVLSLAGPPAQADDTDPLAQLLSPAIEDPLIALLAALPTPYRPYVGPICANGDPQCIVDVITEMQDRLAPLAASCSHHAIFSLAYLRVTQNVKAAADSGYFHDRAWLTQVDAVFAQKYFDTMDAWFAGRTTTVPPAWRIALRAADDRTMSGLGDFMLNMNAHINNDFPYVLEKVGLTAADGTSHKPDHNAYNDRLDSLYHPVFDEEAARFDPMFNRYDLGPVDDLVVSTIMRGWREMVWRHAEALAATRGNPVLRQVVEQDIAEYAATQARMIKLVPIFLAASSPNRDAWCATHHG
ncbi:hypothetical protein EFL26_16100 [Nocardioides pocheonensis]|uniref:Uncharacterized protein n=2 Tax=Nocardioides pocheonensis TaxID=661485 RepID=A0A3N0GKL5_9ACTN|nr:hypothetical protein EFL26_16100 [Nocardioides pocheonensis]